MPPGRPPVPARRQPQPPIQPAQQLRHAQRLHPRRGQLDRQRHPVQPAHQPRHIGAVLIGQREPRIRRAGPVGEQRHRPRDVVIGIARAGHRQRRQPVHRLARDPQRLPAGRQDPHVITGLQQARAQFSGRADHMLAVIQHHQQLPAGQHPRHRLRRRPPRLLPHPQRHRHHRRNPRRIPHRGKLGQPRPVREPGRHPPGHRAGQPGLAHPARPGHHHQPVLLQQARHLAHRPGPADETRQYSRETMHADGGHSGRSPLHPRTITVGSEPGTEQPVQAGTEGTAQDASRTAENTLTNDLREADPQEDPVGSRSDSARNYLGRAGRFGYARLLGSGHQPPEVALPDRLAGAESGASASPTETPQLRDTAVDPHRNPTDETAHSGTLVMRVKGTENSRSAASMRVSWAVGVFSR